MSPFSRRQTNKNAKDWPTFHHLMTCYWHQTADAFYSDFSEALDDFKECEGEEQFQKLKGELEELVNSGRFPRPAQLRMTYNKPFWSGYDRIVTTKDISAAGHLLGTRKPQ